MVKLAEVAPAGTVTADGASATAGFELVIDTVTPALPAGPLSFTVPFVVRPLITVPGVTVKLLSRGAGLTVNVTVLLVPLYVAVIVTDVAVVTVPAVMAKLADVAPAGTVTVAGTVAAGFELASDITTPELPAGELIVTVPAAEAPLAIDVGAAVSPLSEITVGFTVNGAVLLPPR
jgi:hypothetical protein